LNVSRSQRDSCFQYSKRSVGRSAGRPALPFTRRFLFASIVHKTRHELSKKKFIFSTCFRRDHCTSLFKPAYSACPTDDEVKSRLCVANGAISSGSSKHLARTNYGIHHEYPWVEPQPPCMCSVSIRAQDLPINHTCMSNRLSSVSGRELRQQIYSCP
jgi:hypothetical protein